MWRNADNKGWATLSPKMEIYNVLSISDIIIEEYNVFKIESVFFATRCHNFAQTATVASFITSSIGHILEM
jgi:hypothetical protein